MHNQETVSGPDHVGNTTYTSSHSNPELKQNGACIVVAWETTWELQVLLTKTKARLHCRSI